MTYNNHNLYVHSVLTFNLFTDTFEFLRQRSYLQMLNEVENMNVQYQ